MRGRAASPTQWRAYTGGGQANGGAGRRVESRGQTVPVDGTARYYKLSRMGQSTHAAKQGVFTAVCATVITELYAHHAQHC
jgi:hypothetical protein